MSDGITSFFERDHKEIDALIEGISFGDPKEAMARLTDFRRRLERHMHWEEGVLFPAVARKAPQLAMGPIRVMLMEHNLIREHKHEAMQALKRGDGKRAEESVRAMLGVLSSHNAKEEQILYPSCDQIFSDGEAKALLAQVQALGAKQITEQRPA